MLMVFMLEFAHYMLYSTLFGLLRVQSEFELLIEVVLDNFF